MKKLETKLKNEWYDIYDKRRARDSLITNSATALSIGSVGVLATHYFMQGYIGLSPTEVTQDAFVYSHAPVFASAFLNSASRKAFASESGGVEAATTSIVGSAVFGGLAYLAGSLLREYR